jgi:hypothetical protein
MGLGRGIAAASFLHDAEGRTLMRPWGTWGATRLVPPAREDAITDFIDGFFTLMIPLAVVPTLAFGWIGAAALVPLELAVYYIVLHRLTRDLPVVDAAPVETRGDLQVALAHGTSPMLRWVNLAVSSLFAAGGVWMALEGERAGWLVAAFFGLCAGVFAWQLRLLRAARKAEHAAGQG